MVVVTAVQCSAAMSGENTSVSDGGRSKRGRALEMGVVGCVCSRW